MKPLPSRRYHSLWLCLLAALLAAGPVYAQNAEPPIDIEPPSSAEQAGVDLGSNAEPPMDAEPTTENTPAQPGQIPPGLPLKPVPAQDAGSIFFDAAKMASLRGALINYNQELIRRATMPRNVPHPQAPRNEISEDFLTTLTNNKPMVTGPAMPPQQQKQIFSYPQFYLEFLMYHSASSWMVLINGQRFAANIPAEKDADLRVVTIEGQRVVLEWKPKNMERIKESWDGQPSNNVNVDYTAKTVTFALRLNQTFSSYLMQVVEGKVTPVQSLEALSVEPNGNVAFVPNAHPPAKHPPGKPNMPNQNKPGQNKPMMNGKPNNGQQRPNNVQNHPNNNQQQNHPNNNQQQNHPNNNQQNRPNNGQMPQPNNAQKPAVAPQAQPTPISLDDSATPAKNKDQEGLGGLLNNYKNTN